MNDTSNLHKNKLAIEKAYNAEDNRDGASNEKRQLTYEQIKTILDNSFDEIYVVNGQGILIYANAACERHYSLSLSEIIGKSEYEILETGCSFPFLYPIFRNEKKIITLEQITVNGKLMIVTGTPIINNNGEVELIIMNTRDLTHLLNCKYDFEKTKLLSEKYSEDIQVIKKKDFDRKGLVSRSKEFYRCLEIAEKVAAIDVGILITGETGTGKSYLANYIHNLNRKSQGPFIAVNCAAIPDQLLESELFGYRRGAFTGANTDKIGLFELADGGTIFLDEISEMPLRLQGKILDVIQEKRFYPVGANKFCHVNTKILAATNRNIAKLVENGEFREDLYFRLNIIELEIPSLRKRLEDIPLLTDYFINKFNKKHGENKSISNDCINVFLNYEWPGNIRELQNLIERLVLTVNDENITKKHLPEKIIRTNKSKNYNSETVNISLDSEIEELEKKIIISKYRELKSSYKVATALNISQPRAHRLIRKYIGKKSFE